MKVKKLAQEQTNKCLLLPPKQTTTTTQTRIIPTTGNTRAAPITAISSTPTTPSTRGPLLKTGRGIGHNFIHSSQNDDNNKVLTCRPLTAMHTHSKLQQNHTMVANFILNTCMQVTKLAPFGQSNSILLLMHTSSVAHLSSNFSSTSRGAKQKMHSPFFDSNFVFLFKGANHKTRYHTTPQCEHNKTW